MNALAPYLNNQPQNRAALKALPAHAVLALALHYFRLYLKLYDNPNPYRLDSTDRRIWTKVHGHVKYGEGGGLQPILSKAIWYQWALLDRIRDGELPKSRRAAWIVNAFAEGRAIPLAA